MAKGVLKLRGYSHVKQHGWLLLSFVAELCLCCRQISCPKSPSKPRAHGASMQDLSMVITSKNLGMLSTLESLED